VRDFGGGETAYKAVKEFISDTRDLGDMVSWRQAMRDQLFKKGEGRAARALTDVVDQAIDQTSPSGVGVLKEADRAWAHQELLNTLNQRFEKLSSQTEATHSGSNLDNKIRQALTSLKENDRVWHALTPQEQVHMQSIISGGIDANTLRRISNILGGGGGLGTAVSLLVGHTIMGPVGMVAAPVGWALKRIENQLVAQRLRNLRSSVAARSPFTEQLPLAPPSLAGQIGRTIPFVTSAADALPTTTP
jgi:hypothetical protein